MAQQTDSYRVPITGLERGEPGTIVEPMSFAQRASSAMSGALVLSAVMLAYGTSAPYINSPHGIGSFLPAPVLRDRLREASDSSETEIDYVMLATPPAEGGPLRQDEYGPENIAALRPLLGEIFPGCSVEAALHIDPDEGWAKTVVTVHSGESDLESALEKKTQFFNVAYAREELHPLLDQIILVQT